MGEHFKTFGGAVLFLLREKDGAEQILLQKRRNTGYADGLWDVSVSGHVEAGEPLKAALIREAAEELGIRVEYPDVAFATMTHKATENGPTYYNVFFCVRRFAGEPQICEPEKCAEIRWFPLDALPETLLADRRAALENFRAGVPYSEFGWPAG